jgi:phosphonatase-like hydrolase
MKNIKMVVFDMAGTVIDEDNVVYKTVMKAINEAGFHVTLDQVLEQGAGKEKLQAIKSVLSVYANNEDAELANDIYNKFIVYLAEAYDSLDISPQDSAIDLFDALQEHSILIVLNTGYNRETALSILAKLGWEKGVEYDELVTATDVGKNRPSPDMILFAMKQLGVTDASTVVKVGDSVIDIEEGKNAGCGMTIGITTGAHTREQLQTANPDHIIDNLMELLPLLD